MKFYKYFLEIDLLDTGTLKNCLLMVDIWAYGTMYQGSCNTKFENAMFMKYPIMFSTSSKQ